MKSKNERFFIYTDGACKGNPGKGGWSYLILDSHNNIINQNSGSEKEATTNQRMEMKAVIEALKHFQDEENLFIDIFSDSAYIVNCFKEGWLLKWKKNGWVNSQKKEVSNKDLWQIIDEFYNSKNLITFTKVKGHSDDVFNCQVDQMAQRAAFNA